MRRMGAGRRRGWRGLGRAMAIAGLASIGLAQAQTAPVAASRPAKLYGIAGTVTDSVSGQAVAGATMMLLSEISRETVRTAVTDADGHFGLDPLPAGKYSLRAARRGYMTSFFDEHDQYSSAIVVGEGQDAEHIPFHLNPGAMIRGVVTDDGGEPVDGASVLLVHRSKFGGLGEHLVQSVQGTTDDNGLFEFWNLVPGTYFLAVHAAPWFAVHPTAAERMKTADNGGREAAAALDVAYPVTYYGGATDEALATPIEVKSGDRVQADVGLHAVPAVRLTVHVAEAKADPRGWSGGGMLHQTILGNEDFGGGVFAQPGPGSGMMEFVGVAPGHYTLTEGNPPHLTEIDATGAQEVDGAGGVATFGVVLKVRMADGSKPPPNLRATLMSDQDMQRRIQSGVEEKSELSFGSVPPGRWNVLVESGTLALAVVSLDAGTGAVADSRFTLKDRALTLTAVVAQGKTGIGGIAMKQGKGEAGVMVVLAPVNPAAGLALFRRDQSDSDGSFLLRDVAVGSYTIVAIEDGWDLDWARPAVIARYLKGGTPVTVTASDGALMRLSMPVTAQAKR